MQTSYSVDRAGTAEQEAEAAPEAMSDETREAFDKIQANIDLADKAMAKRPRRTREQIEQEKIEKAQQRIEAIKREQRDRRVIKCCELIQMAFRALEPGDAERETVDAIISALGSLNGEMPK